jgi:hypothetical protein
MVYLSFFSGMRRLWRPAIDDQLPAMLARPAPAAFDELWSDVADGGEKQPPPTPPGRASYAPGNDDTIR